MRHHSKQPLGLRARILALAFCAACVAPPALEHTREVRAVEARHAASGRRAVDWRVDALRVRLGAQERARSVRVEGGDAGPLTFRSEDRRVRLVGGEARERFELSAPPGGGLELGGRSYPGTLVIEPHAAGGLSVTNVVELEPYIAGVVPAELILWSAEPAEIEAQAIAARTYALRSYAERRATTRDAYLWDDTRDQVYVGRFDAGSSVGARRVQARLERALAATRGAVLVDDAGEPYDVRFHASCGGHTTTPARAFPRESEVGTGAVACPPCARLGAAERGWPERDERTRQVHWRWTASRADLDAAARDLDVGRHVEALRVVARDDFGRWLEVEVRGDRRSRRVSATRLRAALDPARLKSGVVLSTWPPLGDPITSGQAFEGLGRGHGAGLCQVGSHELAQRGWSARRILSHYISGAHLERLDADLYTRR